VFIVGHTYRYNGENRYEANHFYKGQLVTYTGLTGMSSEYKVRHQFCSKDDPHDTQYLDKRQLTPSSIISKKLTL